jgi:ribosomal protein L31
MKDIIKGVGLMLIFVGSIPISNAGDLKYVRGVIQGIGMHRNNLFVEMGSSNVSVACGTSSYIMNLNEDPSNTKVAVAILLTAYHTGKSVSLQTSSNCHPSWTNREVIDANGVGSSL